MGRLVVVSNRVALPKETRAGGLASALRAALAEHGGLWFGWSGRIADGDARRTTIERDGNIEYELLDLTREEYERYYLGFSNRTLWPLLHFRASLLEYRRADFAGYRAVNRVFAEHLARHVRDDDLVWIHDYHLIPLAAELRALGVGARIGFFLHIPLPPAAMLRILPHHEQLFPSLGACDLIGLQSEHDRVALVEYFRDETDVRVSEDGTLELGNGRSVRISAFPIGIDTAAVARQAERAMTSAATQRLIRSLENRALAIGVDRLDYSKGIPQRFEAFAQFLSLYPEWRSRISFLQIAPPTREEVPEYRELRSRLERLAGATNGRYAEPDWMPIRYVNRSFNQATLAGFYRAADIAVVTPLRDGMNLVAKEFVAAQSADDPGVLILSSFAGAADELRQAIVINPFDADDIAESFATALAMPLAERRERWQAMFDHLRRHDIAAWRASFLDALRGSGRASSGA
jgi:trehalose 6-phosphate synthase